MNQPVRSTGTDPVRVAIVIPACNSEATLAETLESIVKQTALHYVSCVWIADDASADRTLAVAESFRAFPVPLVIERNPRNMGARATLNRLVENLPGHIDWFLILHADEIAKPNWVEVMAGEIQAATDSRIIGLTCSYDVLFEDGRITPGEEFGLVKKTLIEGSPDSVRGTLKQGCWFKISSCAIRKSAFLSLGGFQTDMTQLGDWQFVLRAFRAGWSIEYIPMCLSIYRQTRQSVSSRSFREHRDIREAIRILKEFRAYTPASSQIGRHVAYLDALARRSARSLLTRDARRLRSALSLAAQVGSSMVTNAFARETGTIH